MRRGYRSHSVRQNSRGFARMARSYRIGRVGASGVQGEGVFGGAGEEGGGAAVDPVVVAGAPER